MIVKLSLRIFLIAAHVVIMIGASGPVVQLKGLMDQPEELKNISSSGAPFLIWVLWAAVIAFAILPLRFGHFLSGVVMGALVLIAMPLLRDAHDLVEMDPDLPAVSDVLLLHWGAKVMLAGAILAVVANLAAMATGGRWLWWKSEGSTGARSSGPADDPQAD